MCIIFSLFLNIDSKGSQRLTAENFPGSFPVDKDPWRERQPTPVFLLKFRVSEGCQDQLMVTKSDANCSMHRTPCRLLKALAELSHFCKNTTRHQHPFGGTTILYSLLLFNSHHPLPLPLTPFHGSDLKLFIYLHDEPLRAPAGPVGETDGGDCGEGRSDHPRI